mgnify:CR=1 FL=1|tara:strand:+ start:1472 stop:1684 length:213 start_codon:yes stop_codon:yes gene_type:complete
MDYIEINPKLFEYQLIENGKPTGVTHQLSLKEAKIKNYAFRLNRAKKLYVLKTEIKSGIEKTIIVLPKGN